ncbi:hypothetical protein A6284_26575 [Bacillus wiedmannii]|nr:hypothetical protein A6284_26575 [Bacillus wiedmannii]
MRGNAICAFRENPIFEEKMQKGNHCESFTNYLDKKLGVLGMKKESLENIVVTEVAEFESQLLEVVKAAHEGDENSLEIILKMKQAIGSF